MLREHLLQRMLGLPTDGEYTPQQHCGLHILDDRIYRHKVLRINYTTYDMRRNQDSINPRTHPDVMLLADQSNSDLHPYWYARILDIFHANVSYDGLGSSQATQRWQRIEFLWVRWFELDLSHRHGFRHRRLPRVCFVAEDDPDASPFGFVHPDDLVRAAYLMPAFSLGHTKELLGPSPLARRFDNVTDDDWSGFDVCM